MTTIAQIITDAYQANNLIALSAIPTADEQAKGLRYTNRLFQALFGDEIGDKLSDGVLSVNGITYPDYAYSYPINTFNVRANTRIINSSTAAVTINMPINPQGGARVSFIDLTGALSTNPVTIDASDRLVEGAATKVLDVDGDSVDWFYRDDLASWQKISALELDDEFPLPEKFEELFISLLVLRLDPSVQVSMAEETGFLMKQMLRKLRATYRQTSEQPSEIGLLRTPLITRAIRRTTDA
jgi:hypothetical protein